MVEVAVETGVGVCVMHMQGTPQTMQDNPTYDDVVAEVREYLRDRRDALVAAGMAREQICLDPGIGFGKTHEHNMTLMRALLRISRTRLPAAGRPLAQRLPGQAHRRQRGRPHERHGRAAHWRWPSKACKSCASTTCGRSARRWSAFEATGGLNGLICSPIAGGKPTLTQVPDFADT